MSDVYVWDPFKYPKMGVSIVDALMVVFILLPPFQNECYFSQLHTN